MTIIEFLERLEAKSKKLGVEWKLCSRRLYDDGDRIRSGDHCPLSFVADTNPYVVYTSADKLAMKHYLAERIAVAADHKGNSTLRKKLLKACGLIERS